MSLYLDGSVVVKLLLAEPESLRVAEVVEIESQIIISPLARLETLTTIAALVAGGKLTAAQGKRREALLDEIMTLPKLSPVPCRMTIFKIAESQLATGYCPTLDRLHLAVMQDLGLRRLFTNDDQQAAAARALGFEVILPR